MLRETSLLAACLLREADEPAPCASTRMVDREPGMGPTHDRAVTQTPLVPHGRVRRCADAAARDARRRNGPDCLQHAKRPRPGPLGPVRTTSGAAAERHVEEEAGGVGGGKHTSARHRLHLPQRREGPEPISSGPPPAPPHPTDRASALARLLCLGRAGPPGEDRIGPGPDPFRTGSPRPASEQSPVRPAPEARRA